MLKIFVLTDLVEKLITFIEHEHLQVVKGQVLALSQCKNTSGSADNNVGCVVALEQLYVVIERLATVDNLRAHGLHIFAKAFDLVFNLVSKLTCVAENER